MGSATQSAPHAPAAGCAREAQTLEVTGPRWWEHPGKEFLRSHVRGPVLKPPVSLTRVHLTG